MVASSGITLFASPELKVATVTTKVSFGLTFLEAGNNWNSQKDFNPFDLYRSAGLGVRIFMPAFGLLGIDWGYGFDKLPGQPNRSGPQFHFSIGQQLR